MTETIIEKELCNACGADVRAQADYCYNCGGAVSAEAIAKKTSVVSNYPAREESLKEKTFSADSAANGAKLPEAEASREKSKLQTAAALRRQSKSVEQKTVEIIWAEQGGDAPNGWFIVAAISLALMTGAILLLAMYLK